MPAEPIVVAAAVAAAEAFENAVVDAVVDAVAAAGAAGRPVAEVGDKTGRPDELAVAGLRYL